MKHSYLIAVIFMISMAPIIASAQIDSTKAKKDTITSSVIDTTVKVAPDTVVAVRVNVDTAVIATPMNCYKQYLDYFTELGAKPVPDGMQLVVIAFKKKESCNCLMGRVQVTGGKIKSPVYVQTEGGEYKSFADLGRKLDPDFAAAAGDGLWTITNGMSVVFQTTDQEYGRVFFYKFLSAPKNLPLATILATSLFRSHSQGPGNVSSKSFIPKIRLRSAEANTPKFATCMSPHACTWIPDVSPFAFRSAAMIAAAPRRKANGDVSILA